MIGIDQLFNPNLEIGSWMNSFTTYVSGDITLTLLFTLLFLIIAIDMFKMPEILMVFLLFGVIDLFAKVSTTFNIIEGVAVLFFAGVLWALWPK